MRERAAARILANPRTLHDMKFLLANWKMNLGAAGARELAAALGPAAGAGLEVAVFPPFTALEGVAGTLAGGIALGVQDLYPAEKGAFTGEIGFQQIEEFSVRFVLVGHSERRHLLGEGEPLLRKKLEFVLARSLTPVLCVGETLAEREAGRAEAVVDGQLASALEGLPAGPLLIAYEPVWAIGTGLVATTEQAAAMHDFIRARLAGLRAGAIPVLYGGSVSPATIAALIAGARCDGFLVGGASLKADEFLALARACRAAGAENRR